MKSWITIQMEVMKRNNNHSTFFTVGKFLEYILQIIRCYGQDCVENLVSVIAQNLNADPTSTNLLE
jgi:hypothetical protein